MMEAFENISAKVPNAKLIVAGGDHPQAAGYIDSMKQQHGGNPRIEFLGYVPEDALPDLFQSSSVAVMPYSSSTGSSGVAHLACAYGVPIICADILDFRQMAQGEELAIDFYPSGSAQGLADCVVAFLEDSAKQHAMATKNFSAALRMTMPNVVQKYLRHFELQKRTQALRQLSRVRRLPRWMPSKSLLLRLMTRNSLGWARRAAILHSPVNGHRELQSVHGNDNNGIHRDRSSNPLDGHVVAGAVAGSSAVGGDAASALSHRSGPAGSRPYNDGSEDAGAQSSDQALALHLADHSKPK
jgi:hypothetical protein